MVELSICAELSSTGAGADKMPVVARLMQQAADEFFLPAFLQSASFAFPFPFVIPSCDGRRTRVCIAAVAILSLNESMGCLQSCDTPLSGGITPYAAS